MGGREQHHLVVAKKRRQRPGPAPAHGVAAGLVPATTIIIAVWVRISGRRLQLNPSDGRSLGHCMAAC
jgi:hypothetical protein